ncbi:MAG: M23 family metallopeptidase [Deltaproteobacteria bacterium]|nr:M23 family metallopeptidase [Deltaproteobacteria bacterium]
MQCKIIILMLLVVMLSACSVSGYGSNRVYRRNAIYYTVKDGDTLGSISKKFQVTVEQVALLNGIIDNNKIYKGQNLLIQQAYEYVASAEDKEEAAEEERKDYRIVKHDRQKPDQPRKQRSTQPVYYSDGKLKWPVQGGGNLVSRFGPRSGSFHDGIDIVALSGTPVLAAHDGEVIYADDELGGYGNLLILKGPGNIKTVYAHNRRFRAKKGALVKRGSVIAEVGATGRAEGPHLHFEVRTQDKTNRYIAVDPLPLFQKKYGKPRYRVNDNLTPIITAGDRHNEG